MSGSILPVVLSNYLLLSQVWLPTVQDVLQADWQDVWHSPHPPFFTVFCNLFVFNVFTCFIFRNLLSSYICQKYIIFSTIKKVFFCKADIRNPLSLLAHERSRFATCQWELLTPTDISIPLTHRLVLYALEAGECLFCVQNPP